MVLLQRDELQLLPQEIAWFVGFRDLAQIPLSRNVVQQHRHNKACLQLDCGFE